MAISAPTEYAAVNLSSQTSISVVNPTLTVPVGTLLVLVGNHGAGKTISSVSDDAGNIWSVDHTYSNGTQTVGFASSYLTSALASTNAISVTWSSSTSSSAGIWLEGMTGGAATGRFDKSADNNQTSSSQNWSCGPTGTLAQANEIAFCCGRCISATAVASANAGWAGVTTVAAGLIYALPSTTAALTGSLHYSNGTTGAQSLATYKGSAAAAPVNTVAPAVTGTPHIGQTLTSGNGTWTDNGSPVFTYQWQRDNLGGGTYSSIVGATSSTYVPVSIDDGCHVRCVVADNTSDGVTAANSNSVAVTFGVPVNTVAPVVTGNTIVGSTLSCSTGAWS